MSVFIKEMDKPKKCDECFFDYLQKHPYCDGDILHCPLVEVKTPHGRLVDIDKVMRVIASGVRLEAGEMSELTTVIEAEAE